MCKDSLVTDRKVNHCDAWIGAYSYAVCLQIIGNVWLELIIGVLDDIINRLY